MKKEQLYTLFGGREKEMGRPAAAGGRLPGSSGGDGAFSAPAA